MSEERTVGTTVGNKEQVECLKCTGSTLHEVLASVDFAGQERAADFEWRRHYQIVACGGCSSITFRVARTDSEDWEHDGDREMYHRVEETLYPPRVAGRRALDEADLAYLHDDISRIYRETAQALVSDMPVITGVGLRAIIETICKSQNAEGRDLQQKIDNMVEKKLLSERGAEVLHKIRSMGNKAAHEVKPHNTKALAMAMDVVESLLRDVYIHPKKAKSVFE